jgi:hypothetical protein
LVPRVGLEPGQLPVAGGFEGEAAQPDGGAEDGDRAGRGPLQHADLDREAVLAHGLNSGDLEAGVLDQSDRLPHRAHVHVGCDVGLDERAAARRAGIAGHLLDEEPTARLQHAVQCRAEPGVVREADVLAHLDRRNRVVGSVQLVAVVLDPDLGLVAKVVRALADVAALPGGQRHGGDPGLVVAGGVDGQRSPAAAHVEQPLPRLQLEFAADRLQLGALGGGQGVRDGPPPARVGHAGVQDELVERGGQVVVAGDHRLVPDPAVPAAADPELAVRCGRRGPDRDPEPGDGPGRGEGRPRRPHGGCRSPGRWLAPGGWVAPGG